MSRDDETPLSVLHLCAPASVGGLERVVQALAMGSHRRGHEVRVLAVVEPEADTDPFFEPIRDAGVETLRIEAGARDYLGEYQKVGAALRELGPDVVHCHGYRTDILHGAPARKLGIATVSTLHGSSLMGGMSRVFEWLQGIALRYYDAVVAVSEPLAETLVKGGVPAARVHQVRNGWAPPPAYEPRTSAREFFGVAPDEVVLGWVGRLIPVKGCDVFLEALARLPKEGWTARVVGDGGERAELEALAQRLGLGDQVVFTGAIPDAAHLFRALDVFVLSSRSEGTPMVLLEAMGAGVAAIASAVGGVPDVISSATEGWTVPPESPESLAEALAEAVAQADTRRERAEAGEARVRDAFDVDRWIRAHDTVYRAAIQVRSGAD